MESVLAIDIGGGTQDILLYEPGKPVENCVQLILPSQTVIVGEKIAKASALGKDVFLYGSLMGGGACVKAIKKHLENGLKVYATPQAAKTIADDLKRVESLGVIICEEKPQGTVEIKMGDIDLETLAKSLAPYGVLLPKTTAVAVQDHGESIGYSNRLFRFELWKRFCESGGDIRNLIFQNAPESLTRMKSAIAGIPNSYVMDTGAAAIWGALCDPKVKVRQQEGLIIVNIGNQHTVAVLLQDFRVWGLFEHHTRLLSKEKLFDYIERLRVNTLTNAEIYEDGGHGCFIHPDFNANNSYSFVAVTGPQRQLVGDEKFYYAAPYGDMMLSGCFGLVAALNHKKSN